jgi:folate-dependent phosphoribosylglycinamide formyltransferase PurN
MDKQTWIAFFSQTGAEIADISESIGRWPDIIITNERPDHLRTIDSRIEKQGYYTWANKPTEEDYIDLLENYTDAVITLHGWLRVVPAYVCERSRIYNGHPGLITQYPELKGKDPQIRAYEGIKAGKYNTAGAVIHKVTAGVDEGRVIMEEYFNAWNLELDDLFRILRDRSLYMWCSFLKKILWLNE